MNNNIILIGMPGSGKSTLGVLLAKYSGYSFVDLDLIITKKTGKKLQKILDQDGYNAFLKIENQVGKELDCEKTVVATGGSMVLSAEGMEHLKKIGTVVYINVPIDEIIRRVTNVATRGIAFKAGETLNFGGLLGYGPVMPLRKGSPAEFINRGGRIPAPLQALKN